MKAGLLCDFFVMEQDLDARQVVLAINDSRLRFPVVVIEDDIVADPTVAALQRVVERHQGHGNPAR